MSTSFSFNFLRFLIKSSLCYTFIYILIFLYQGMVFSDKVFEYQWTTDIAHFVRSLDLHGKYTQSILRPAIWILELLGFDIEQIGTIVRIAGYPGIIMHFACLGFNIMGAFVALMIAFPDHIKIVKKISFILLVIFIIHVLNILRVTGLVLRDHYKFDLYYDQHDIFNFILYIIILFFFFQWISYSSRSNSASFEPTNVFL